MNIDIKKLQCAMASKCYNASDLALYSRLSNATISRIFTYELIDPILVYKKVFHSSVLKYLFLYISMTFLIFADCGVSKFIISIIPVQGIIGFILKIILFSIVFNAIFFGVTCKTSQFKSIRNRVLRIIRKK